MRSHHIRQNLTRALVVAAGLTACTAANALTVNVDVPALDGPWIYANGGLNTNFQYGVGDEGAPLVVSSANDLAFVAGMTLTVDYMSGSSNEGGGYNSPDAEGDPGFIFNNNNGSSGHPAPSFYFDPATYPAYLGELVGTFANSSGQIVGRPFNVGDALTVTIPTGATQLQLGINDDIYNDNTGDYHLTITGAAVPEPSASAFLSMASMVVATGYLIRRRTMRA